MSEHPPRGGPTAPAGYKTLAEAAARYAQRLKYTHAKAEHRFARDIGDGRLPLWTLPGMARLVPAADQTLDFARSEVRWPASTMSIDFGDDDSVSIGRSPDERIPVVVDEDDIERVLDELAPATAAPAPTTRYQPASGEPPQAPPPSAPRPPGRPSEYDWPWYEAQARRRVYQHGLPERSSIIVAELLALFGRKLKDNQPEQRTVERMVAKWWPSLLTLSTDIEELSAPCEITPVSNGRR